MPRWLSLAFALMLPGCPQLLDDDFDTLSSSGVAGAAASSMDPTIKVDTSTAGAAGAGVGVSQGGSTSINAGGAATSTSISGAGGAPGTIQSGAAASGAGGSADPRGTGGSDILDAGADPSNLPAIDVPDGCERMAFDNADYLFCSTEVTYEGAVAWCLQQDMLIVRPSSASENNWVHQTFQDLGVEEFWIEGNDKQQEGVWLWEDGTQIPGPDEPAGDGVEFQDWAPDEPTGETGQNCVSFQDDGWHDRTCATPFPFACEPPA